MPLRVCVLLWERDGRAEELAVFEDAVLALLPVHGGHLVARDTVVDRRDGDPLEIQLIEMPDDAALAEFLHDPIRIELARIHDRDAIIGRTQLLKVRSRA